jgi:hypothetical protein
MIAKVDFDYQTYEEGCRRLREWLPSAHEDVVSGKVGQMVPYSTMAKSVLPFINEDNFEALLIHPAAKGGWQTNLLLKSTPMGTSSILGSPADTPFETHSEAVEFARRMLMHCVAIALANRENPPETQPLKFRLFDWTVELSPEALKAGEGLSESIDEDVAIGRITEMLGELCPGGFSPDLFGTWTKYDKTRFMMVIHVAAMAGVFGYPPESSEAS